MTEATIQGIAETIRARHPVTCEVHVRAGDCHLAIHTNSGALGDKLSSYFCPWLVPPGKADLIVTALESDAPDLALRFVDWERDAGKAGRKDTIADLEDGRAVRKVRTGMQYLLGLEERLVFGRTLQNYNQVVNFAIAQLINWQMHRGMLLCHAAGVMRGSRGLALAGISGAGKSTLALRLVARGATFASNDRLLVGKESGRAVMTGVPKQPRVNPGTLLTIPALSSVLPPERRRALASLPPDDLFLLEEKYDADIGSLFGPDRFRLKSPLDAFLVLRWSRHDPGATRFSRVDIASHPEVLEAIMKPPGPFFARPGERPTGVHRQTAEDYAAALGSVRVYEATGQLDFEKAHRFAEDELLGSTG